MKQEKHNFGILLPFDFSTKKSQRLLLREAFGVFIIRDQLNIISKDSLIQWNSESTLKRSCDLLRLGLSNLNHVFHIARCPSMTGAMYQIYSFSFVSVLEFSSYHPSYPVENAFKQKKALHLPAAIIFQNCLRPSLML